jgi:hypothetical protein
MSRQSRDAKTDIYVSVSHRHRGISSILSHPHSAFHSFPPSFLSHLQDRYLFASYLFFLFQKDEIKATMYASKLLALIAFAAAPVWGHGKVTAASGDLGGKGTGLGILGGAANANSQADVTVFKQATGLGATQGVSHLQSLL